MPNLLHRDRYENGWHPKICAFKNNLLKSECKNQLQLYWYNTNNTITSFKVVYNVANLAPHSMQGVNM